VRAWHHVAPTSGRAHDGAEHMPKSTGTCGVVPKRLISGRVDRPHTGASSKPAAHQTHPEQVIEPALGSGARRQYGERVWRLPRARRALGSPRARASSRSSTAAGTASSSTTEPLALELPLHDNVRGQLLH